ncbi:MAG: tripartite tricarboxylate transporter substrate binding protein, partial [Betaproteobacteria bacterium]|nr:tripartite tricarboxylate transporter substrate binding protein [Betaproteobacteria bacterium]
GSTGVGTASHLANELFTATAGVKALHIPYKSAGLAATALLAGEIQFMVTNMATALPHVRAGRLKGLGVTSGKRVAVAAELPTLHEAGLAGFEYTTWYGLLAPRGTPAGVTVRVHEQLTHIAQDAAVKSRLSAQGLEPRFSAPQAFERYLQSELMRWERVVQAAGLIAD